MYKINNLNNTDVDNFYNSYQIYDRINMCNSLEDYNNNIPLEVYDIDNKYIDNYYKILNLLCALGSVKKMYIPPIIDINKSIIENQILFEQNIAKYLNISYGTLLEIGCGCGRISYHISKLTNSHVYGLNIDATQIDDAKKHALKMNNNKLHFTVGNLNNKLPYINNKFDSIYGVQPFSYSKNLEITFKEVYRICKPGGYFVMSDFVLLDNFNKHNRYHLKLLRNFLQVIGGGGAWHYKYWESTLKKAGFMIVFSNGTTEEEMIVKENKNFDKINYLITILSKTKILNKNTKKLIDRLQYGVNDLITAEKLKLLTMNWLFIAKKPNLKVAKL